MTDFRWTEARDKAAILVAADRLTVAQIAEEIGISRQSLHAWKQQPEFIARVQEHLDEVNRRLAKQEIRHKTLRVSAQHDRWMRMQQVISERAADDSWSQVPGWNTGLLVHRQKQIGAGRAATVVDEFEVDTGLLAELRNTEKQAAQELGQWVEKSSLTDGEGNAFDLAMLVRKARGDDAETH